MSRPIQKLLTLLHRPPRLTDAILLSAFAAVITLQPYFWHGRINLFEVGLYLPGIDTVLKGGVPFRDVFHLRGPFELYMPAAMMRFFGDHLAVLYAYFYLGSVLTLIVCVFIGREIFRTRYVLWLFAPVFVARTWPRVVFHIWGGMRYVFGLTAILWAVQYFMRRRLVYLFLAGLATSCGIFTSIEIGACAFLGITAALAAGGLFNTMPRRESLKGLLVYGGGCALVAVPYLLYLHGQGALGLYFDSVYAVVTNMQKVIDPHTVSVYPSNAAEALAAMVNPLSKNFRHLTPAYLYVVLVGFLAYRWKTRSLNVRHTALVCIGVYGFVMYNTSFRSIWAAQFEMALQPEKLLFFFLLEEAYVFLRRKKAQWRISAGGQAGFRIGALRLTWPLAGIYFLLLAFFMSSVNYALMRYARRFPAYQIARNVYAGRPADGAIPFAEEPGERLTLDRAEGIIVPVDQARELQTVIPLIRELTAGDERLFMYPEMPTYYFFAERPFAGRFPVPTFAWFDEAWQKEMMEDLKNSPPRYVLLEKDLLPRWKDVYFALESNRKKYQEVIRFVRTHYVLEGQTPKSLIYKRKDIR